MTLRASIQAGLMNQSSAQVIDGSLRFDDDNRQFLKKTFSSGNSKTWTWSAWIKRDNFGSDHRLFTSDADANNQGGFKFIGDQIQFFSRKSGTFNINLYTAAVLRDTGWYHLMVAVDTTISSPSTDRVKLYVNGALQTIDSSYNTYPSQNYETRINTNIEHLIGRYTTGDSQYMNGAMSQVYFIDGLQLGPENFGFTDPLTNTWRPKKYTGSFAGPVFGYSGTIPTSLTNVAPSGGYGNGIATAAELFGGTLLQNGDNHIRQDGGGFEWSAAIPLSNGDVAGAQCLYFNNTSTHAIEFKIDGNWVTAQSNAQNVIGSTQGQGALITYTASGSVNWTGVRATGGSNISVTTVAGIFVNGDLVGPQTTPPNGFYLPMDGNSPIGQDKSGNGNDWTPVRFGNTNKIDSPDLTGGTPILNTNEAGTVALPGYFGQDEYRYYTVSSSSGGGNPYIIDDVGTQPTFSFVRGAKYVFDYSSATSHPLRFATAADAAGSTQYTTGTVVSGNTITFTVPHDAPSTLYYYCTNHSGMGNSISVTTDTKRADPYAQNLVCALPLTGAEGDNDFVDIGWLLRSTTYGGGKTFTAFTGNSDGGGTTSTRGSVLYGSSFYTTRGATNSNAGDYIERTGDNDLSMGTGDYTIEFWFHPYQMETNDVLIDTRHPTTDWPNDDNGIMIYINANGETAMVSNGVQISGSGVVGKNQDNHFALTREGTTERLFVNGNLIGTATGRSNDYNRQRLHLGSSAPNGEGSSGYYNDLRVYKGVAKYTSSFKVGSPNPTVLPDTPSGVSGGSKLTKITDGAVSFDGTNDNLTINAHSDLDLSSGDFTVEGFVYPQRSQEQSFVTNWNSGGQFQVQMSSTGTLQASWAPYSTGVYAVTGSTPIRVNSWSHFAYTRSGNTFELFLDGISQGTQTSSANGTTNNNVVLGENGGNGDRDLQGFLSNVRIIKGTALYTSNFTPPTRELTNVTNTKLLCCQSPTSASAVTAGPNLSTINDGTYWSGATLTNGSNLAGLFDESLSTNAQQSTNGTAASITNFGPVNVSSTVSFYSPDGDARYTLNGGSEVSVSGTGWHDISFSGTLTSFTFQAPGNARIFIYGMKIDGTQLVDIITPNGDAAATTFNPFTTDINTVRGQETGYATWNPLKMGTSDVSMSEGNLFWRTTSNGPDRCTYSTIGMDSGKFYWENEIVEATATAVGIANELANDDGGPALAHNWMYYSATGQVYLDGSASSYGAAYNTNGTIIGVAFDRDNLTLEFYKNGVSQGKLTSISGLTDSETYFAMCGDSGGASQSQVRVNFGQKPFKFPPPEGFQPLNGTTILPETVIARPDQFVTAKFYSGENNTRSINIGMKPDFVWFKSRNQSYDHELYDSVRGATKRIYSNTNDQEASFANGLTSFDYNGFSVGNRTNLNGSSSNMVVWGWKAGGNKGTFNVDDSGYASASAAGITDGTIALTGASVGTKQGFSILKYTGSGSNGTLAHGLSQAPDFFFGRDLEDTGGSRDWIVYHKTMGNTGRLKFAGNASISESSTFFQNTSPTNSLISVGTSNDINSTNDYIMYCYHNVPGLQKFGGYTGNGSDNGPFVETGFRPALIWTRAYSSNSNNNSHWLIYDTLINPHNESSEVLYINLTNGVNSHVSMGIDILSNGFRLKADSSGYSNYNGWSYVYCAWAEAPAFNLFGGQSNAR